jgi:hypothetical protein
VSEYEVLRDDLGLRRRILADVLGLSWGSVVAGIVVPRIARTVRNQNRGRGRQGQPRCKGELDFHKLELFETGRNLLFAPPRTGQRRRVIVIDPFCAV